MTCKDWTSELWGASFNGIGFHVDSYSFNGGKRIKVHQFPNAQHWVSEELGSKYRTLDIEGYVANDNAYGQSLTLFEALNLPGTGLISLPGITPLVVKCEDVTRKFSKDKLGYSALSIRLILESPGAAATPIGLLSRFVGVAATAVFAAAGIAFRAIYLGKVVSGITFSASAQAIQQFGGVILDIKRTASLTGDNATLFERYATELINDAHELSIRGHEAASWGVAAEYVRDGTGLPERIAMIGEALVEAIETPLNAEIPLQEAFDAMEYVPPLHIGLTDEEINNLPALERGIMRAHRIQPDIDFESDRKAVHEMGRQCLIAVYCDVASRIEFDNRRQAIRTRAQVAMRITEAHGGCTNREIMDAITDMGGRAADYISRSIADQAPILGLEAPKNMPSVYWAHRLYNDPERADELALLNREPTPMFMSRCLEAKSK